MEASESHSHSHSDTRRHYLTPAAIQSRAPCVYKTLLHSVRKLEQNSYRTCNQFIIRTAQLGTRTFQLHDKQLLVLVTGNRRFFLLYHQSHIKTPTPLNLLTRRLPHPTSHVIYTYTKCRGVPAASKGEEDSSKGSYLRACQRALPPQAILGFVCLSQDTMRD